MGINKNFLFIQSFFLLISFSFCDELVKSAYLLLERVPDTEASDNDLGNEPPPLPVRPLGEEPVAPFTTQTPGYFFSENIGSSKTIPINLNLAQGIHYPTVSSIDISPPTILEEEPLDTAIVNKKTSDCSRCKCHCRCCHNYMPMVGTCHFNQCHEFCESVHKDCPHGEAETNHWSIHPLKRLVKISKVENDTIEGSTEEGTMILNELKEVRKCAEHPVEKMLTPVGMVDMSHPSESSFDVAVEEMNIAAAGKPIVKEITSIESAAVKDCSIEILANKLDTLAETLLSKYSDVLKIERDASSDRALLRSIMSDLRTENKIFRMDNRLLKLDIEIQLILRTLKGLEKEDDQIIAALEDAARYAAKVVCEQKKVLDYVPVDEEDIKKHKKSQRNLMRREAFAQKISLELEGRLEKNQKERKELEKNLELLNSEKVKIQLSMQELGEDVEK